MSETQLTDAQALALAGTTDSETDFAYHTVGQSTYYLDGFRQRHRILTILKAANALRAYKDGDLTFGVRAGRFANGDTMVDYAGATAQALTNNATNTIYLTAAGTLTVNTTGFPDPSAVPHVPLATIVTAAGTYDVDDITDYRSRTMFQVLWPVRELMPTLALTGADDADGTGTMTIQVRDAGNVALAGRYRIRTWIADAEYSEPDPQTDFSVTTGEALREIAADADYEVITDATGQVVMNIDTATDKTVYVMAEIDGAIYTGSVAITGN